MVLKLSSHTTHFIPFKSDTSCYTLPDKFTFPFHYTPHPLSILASHELQAFLKNQTHWHHNFGLDDAKEGIVVGKMFGVLVVQNAKGELGQLWAVSGKLLGENDTSAFVPSINESHFDDHSYQDAKDQVASINTQIERMESSEDFKAYPEQLNNKENLIFNRVEEQKALIRTEKARRNDIREKAKCQLSEHEYQDLLKELAKQSIDHKITLKKLTVEYGELKKENGQKLEAYLQPYNLLIKRRRNILVNVQKKQIERFKFLNIDGKEKGIYEIFGAEAPAGSGDCAAPKLLQYAFKNQLTPIAMAEFWWGASPKLEVRNHGHYYPSCKSRCRPILAHMLEGMQIEDDPLLQNAGENTIIKTIFEDSLLLIINKPPGLLSVPGINISDSVATRLAKKYPGSSIVHRLDQDTSGIMLIAKDQKSHKILQQQFIKRTIEKKYHALLDGVIDADCGEIDLPLRVDLDNRPYQLVCYQYGKKAITKFKVIEKKDGKTRIEFTPITGRTHQLRVHAAHIDGLHAPIVGDSLYGTESCRLHLHAQWIKFRHPATNEEMIFEVYADF